MTPPRGVEDAAPYRDGPKPPPTPIHARGGLRAGRPTISRSPHRRGGIHPSRAPPGQHPFPLRPPVGAGHARPATLRRRPLLLCHPVSPRIVGRGLDPSACPFPSLRRGGIYAAHKSLHPHQTIPPTPIICARHPPITQYTPYPNFSLKLCRKNQKTCKNLLTKVILLAIIIKLSREPSPRRQPLEPLPTACTPFFEENFFKKLSENLLTNERI